MQRNIITTIMLLLVVAILSACNGAAETALPEDPSAKVTAAVQTVYAQVSMTSEALAAMATATPTNTVVPTQTPTTPPPTATPTNEFIGTLTAQAAEAGAAAGNQAQPAQDQQAAPAQQTDNTANSGKPCLRANLEWESIPDGTEIAAGRTFVKTWRLKNTGSCNWTNEFILRFIDGELLGAGASIRLTDEIIPPNGYANVDVDMEAPLEAGTYKGYWKLVSDKGKIFGVGTDGKGWIWIEIEVFIES